jgi:hypothetical protein
MMPEILESQKNLYPPQQIMRTYCQGKVKFTIQQTHRMIRANKYAAGNDYSLLCVCVLVSGVRFVYFPMPKTPTREHRLWQAEGDRVLL